MTLPEIRPLGVLAINDPVISHFQDVIIISKKGLLHINPNEADAGLKIIKHVNLNQLSQTEEGRKKIARALREHLLGYKDQNENVHVHGDLASSKNLASNLKGKIKGTVQTISDEEYNEFQDVISQLITIITGSKEESKKATNQNYSSNPHSPVTKFSIKDVSTVTREFQLKYSEIITKLLESFTEAAKHEATKKEAHFKQQVIKDADLKQRLINWDLKVWNIKVENIKLQSLDHAYMVYDRKDRSRDWVLLHPHNVIGDSKPA